MPLFEYKAVSPAGETVSGTMEAASLDLVILKLQEAGNIPLQAKEAGSGGLGLGKLNFGNRGMNSREVGQFTQQLATLLGAGLPLDRSLAVLMDLADTQKVQRTVSEIRDHVREGGTLSDALESSMAPSADCLSTWFGRVKLVEHWMPLLAVWQTTWSDQRSSKTA